MKYSKFSHQSFCIGTLAASSLIFEGTLTRLLAVSQFYHFAFLVVSLALLGFGASGSILYIYNSKRGLNTENLNSFLLKSGLIFFVSVGLVYGFINILPFDSYSIAWDKRQIGFFLLYYLALTLPFFICGLATGAALSLASKKSNFIYAANLVGSGIGVLLTPVILNYTGVPGGVLFSALLGLISATPFVYLNGTTNPKLHIIVGLLIGGGIFSLGYLARQNLEGNGPLGFVLTPYKELAQTLRHPQAEKIYARWNAIGRIDILKNTGIHRYPGLSYQYDGDVPQQYGLSIDAGPLQPIVILTGDDVGFTSFLPEALVFDLKQNPSVLVLQPGGGLGVLQALSGRANSVTAIVDNPLVAEALGQLSDYGNIYQHSGVITFSDNSRAYLEKTSDHFDVIFIPLVDTYRPVANGAFSLTENFELTREGFLAVIEKLQPGGVLVISRWLQTPPSESIRVFATLFEAVEESGMHVPEIFVAYRSVQTMTILLKPSGWDQVEIQKVRSFTGTRKYDLVMMPGLEPGDVNRYNKLPEPSYFQLVQSLIENDKRVNVYREYRFQIAPPTDDHPFFYHFFKWEQIDEMLASFGHVWQPFGGGGYLVLFVLLAMVVVMGILLIFFPLFLTRNDTYIPGERHFQHYGLILLYFSSLGFAFLFVEIPLIQKTILLLGHPIYAFTTVVFTVLFFAGLGSSVARIRVFPQRVIMLILPIVAVVVPVLFSRMVYVSLGYSIFLKVGVVIFSLAPLSFLMGFPFPAGLGIVESLGGNVIPWVWAVNGSISVAASVLAAIIVLSYGFNTVLFVGAVLYGFSSMLYFKLSKVV